MSVIRIFSSCLFYAIFLFTGCAGKDNPDVERKCFPVPIKAGDETVVSSLYLELDFVEYNKPYNEFAKSASTEEEKFIRDIFKMISDGDVSAAEKTIANNS